MHRGMYNTPAIWLQVHPMPNLIIILIDARQGVVEQTRRHSIIASLLKIPHVVVAINKMDLVDYSQDVYNNIVIDYSAVAKQLGLIRYFLYSHQRIEWR